MSLANVQVLVARLNETGSAAENTPVIEEAAEGEVGELCIGGPGVCPGFHCTFLESEAGAFVMGHAGGAKFRAMSLDPIFRTLGP